MHVLRKIVLLISLSSITVSAQKVKPSLRPYDAIGIVAGYHFKEGGNFVELGISRGLTIHGQFGAYAISTEYSKVNDEDNYGFTLSGWLNSTYHALLSLGAATTYYSDFNNQRAVSLRPMIGLGIYGVQVVYEYDLLLLKPNYDFGSYNRIAIRINLGLLELNK